MIYQILRTYEEHFIIILQELNPNNESHKKDVEKRRAVINTASKLHNKLLNRYSMLLNRNSINTFSENMKKRLNFLNYPEMLVLILVKIKIFYH